MKPECGVVYIFLPADNLRNHDFKSTYRATLPGTFFHLILASTNSADLTIPLVANIRAVYE